MRHADCDNLFEAAKALIQKSRLAGFDGEYFVAATDIEEFKRYWKREFHPDFGRYMAWVLFSVGAENLAKAACVCNGTMKVESKATLGTYTRSNGHFKKLLVDSQYNQDKDTLLEGYKRLTTVRNRDAHSYQKNKRDADFHLIKEEFVPALNVLVNVVRHNYHPVSA